MQLVSCITSCEIKETLLVHKLISCYYLSRISSQNCQHLCHTSFILSLRLLILSEETGALAEDAVPFYCDTFLRGIAAPD